MFLGTFERLYIAEAEFDSAADADALMIPRRSIHRRRTFPRVTTPDSDLVLGTRNHASVGERPTCCFSQSPRQNQSRQVVRCATTIVWADSSNTMSVPHEYFDHSGTKQRHCAMPPSRPRFPLLLFRLAHHKLLQAATRSARLAARRQTGENVPQLIRR